eukprot:COSAG02_NODE_47699_length_339_cov_0.850000_1_plen_45_part_10
MLIDLLRELMVRVLQRGAALFVINGLLLEHIEQLIAVVHASSYRA